MAVNFKTLELRVSVQAMTGRTAVTISRSWLGTGLIEQIS